MNILLNQTPTPLGSVGDVYDAGVHELVWDLQYATIQGLSYIVSLSSAVRDCVHTMRPQWPCCHRNSHLPFGTGHLRTCPAYMQSHG